MTNHLWVVPDLVLGTNTVIHMLDHRTILTCSKGSDVLKSVGCFAFHILTDHQSEA